MKLTNFQLEDPTVARKLAEQIRSPQEPEREIAERVSEILDQVNQGGDKSLVELVGKFDGLDCEASELRVDVREITSALEQCDPKLRRSLDLAAENIRTVAESQISHEHSTTLAHGQVVRQLYRPVRRVGVYVPGGGGAYPSTVLMNCIPAQVAKVQEIAVCTPADRDGKLHPLVLAACAISGVSELYCIGGAQAIAAMAYGTETVKPVDLIVGPGNHYVQEAKRQLTGYVGIDSIAGPSELLVIADQSADPGLIALDLLAQAEHGPGSLLVVASPDQGTLDKVAAEVESLAEINELVAEAELSTVLTSSLEDAVILAEEIAPEHLELVCEQAEQLLERVSRAGCVFVGRNAATAFGDYVVGSNHVLPTGGTARFASALGLATFQRRMACVSLSDEAVDALAPHVDRLARGEGFPIHGQSVERRLR